MYRPPKAAGRAGAGISADGYDGARSFFEQVAHVSGELKIAGLPTGAQETAAAKAAVDAYMTARNGVAPGNQALAQNGKMPGDFPQVDLKADVSAGMTDAGSPLVDIGKAVSDMMSHMGDMLNQMVQGPMGILGSILGFLFKLFTDVASTIGQALNETMHAAAAAVEDAWKKQMETASTAGNTGLQPLELFNQSATTQTVSHALKNSST